MRRPAVLGHLIAVALVVGLVGAPVEAKVAGVDSPAYNVPAPWGTPRQHWVILRGVRAAIANVPRRSKRNPHPTIHIATFLLDSRTTVDQLIAACRRGVSVRVILDDDIASRQARRLRSTLNADNVRDRNRDGRADRRPDRGPCDTKLVTKKPKKKAVTRKRDGQQKLGKKGARKERARKERARNEKSHKKKKARDRRPRPIPLVRTWGRDRSYVKTCSGACRGPAGNMHSKFYLFSQTGPYRRVIKLSSSNLNRGGALRGWNDMWTIRQRPTLYRAFTRVHRIMTRDRTRDRGLIRARSGPYLVRFYPQRKSGPRNDPVARDLDRIRCRPANGRGKRTTVLVSMFYWKGTRGVYLADQLIALGRRGCRVRVVVGAPSKQIADRLRTASRRRVITAYDSRWDLNADGVIDKRTHAKFVLVKGRYGRERRSHQVMTGSGNWVRGSLVGGDEVSLTIRGRRPYRQYARAWDRIRDHSRVMGRW